MVKDSKLEQTEFFNEFTTEDYAFIIDDAGELKSVLMPADGRDLPQAVKKVFRVFGIKNPLDVQIHTVH